MRNAFGEVLQDIIYANVLNLDMSQYLGKELPLSVVAAAVQLNGNR